MTSQQEIDSAGARRATANELDVELQWANKHLLLDSRADGSYEWVARDDPRAAEIRSASLTERVGKDAGDRTGPPNLAILGDSLHALGTLAASDSLGDYVGRVRLVYVDPPFNTRQGFGHYQDALRTSMWLSMLRDRMVAVQPLLHPMASVWVHLDDAEVHRARLVLDEVFGRDAFVATIVWQNRTTRDSRAAFSSNHEYIHVYAPIGPRKWKEGRNHLARDVSLLRNRDDDPRGPWADAPFTAPGYRENQQYAITTPTGRQLRPPSGRSWYATEEVYRALLMDSRIWFPKGGAGSPRIKIFAGQTKGLVPFSVWPPEETGTNDDATRHLMSLLPDREPFATPKPEALMHRVVHVASSPGDLVLDFFAGSGTTAAVAHKMGRSWIAIESSPVVFERFTLARLKKVILGQDPWGVTPLVGWGGGGGFSVFQIVPSQLAPSHSTVAIDFEESSSGALRAG